MSQCFFFYNLWTVTFQTHYALIGLVSPKLCDSKAIYWEKRPQNYPEHLINETHVLKYIL